MQKELIDWYKTNHRMFPWRENEDPYRIWISEIMLQQTTTEAVIPYFNRFMNTFDNIQKLANASLEDVYKMWEGLGYYRRAKHLHETAKIIVEQYDGLFPTLYDEVISLKGIGHYTAGAICSIAFHQHVAAIDGNVLRIIARVYLLKDNIALMKTQKKINLIVNELIQDYDASSFNQGLMDLGATICRPVNPKCEICPISKYCLAYKHQQQNILPINIKNIKHQELNYITAIITYNDRFLLIKNPPGLLENLYGFIQYNIESPYSFIEEFQKDYHVNIAIQRHIKNVKHVFTHRTWHMNIYHFTIDKPLNNMYTLDQIKELPISTAHLKVLKAYLK